MASSRKVCRKDIPRKQNERLVFEKALWKKLEEFKLARSKWVESTKNKDETNTSSVEGHEPNVYRGRCGCLRKLGFSTKGLRNHYKTVRPWPYFTLKEKVSETRLLKLTREQKRRVNEYLSELDSLEDYSEEVIKLKEKLWDEKEAEVREKVNEKLGKQVKEKKRKKGSQKVMEKLRAGRQARGMVESCRCNNGKEVTVVIKGFCLCDKGNLKKLKLDKIGDDYNKLEELKPQEPQQAEPHMTDSVEIYRNRKSAKLLPPKEEKEHDEAQRSEERKSEKSVSFKLEGKSKLKKPVGYETQELVKKQQEMQREKIEEDQQRKGRTAEEEMKTRKEAEEWEEERRRVKKENKRKSPEIMAQSHKNSSFLTLFENSTPNSSEMGLTKEQFEKLKKSGT